MRSGFALAEEFIARFCAGDLQRLGELLTEDFRFRGPYFAADSRSEYLASLESDPPDPGSAYDLLEARREGERVLLVYRFHKPGTSIRITQSCRRLGDRLREVTLRFDDEVAG